MSSAKKLAAVLVVSAALHIGSGAAQAAPKQIDCREIKAVQAVNLDCAELPAVNPRGQKELNVQETRLIYPEVACGVTARSAFRKLQKDIQLLINRAAQRVGLSPALVGAVARAESGGNPSAVSPAGAVGVMQLMPATAAGLGVNPYDPEQNIYGGAQYLRFQVDRFGGDITKALAAYNAGPGAVEKYGGLPPYKETREFVARVMMFAGR
ncbi:lytic transglycosylase domain-containing protein [Pelotomaculum sp. FP]|uniref:lytic transglycosylase domain-containing protein n=1 Tax=Pelotomaculum sp. FP TaxID=261474 RepID=UPI0010663ACC|nr:lytic transglycosylase domain-containing protein [Pelotomaculum sp. FP]